MKLVIIFGILMVSSISWPLGIVVSNQTDSNMEVWLVHPESSYSLAPQLGPNQEKGINTSKLTGVKWRFQNGNTFYLKINDYFSEFNMLKLEITTQFGNYKSTLDIGTKRHPDIKIESGKLEMKPKN